MVEILTAADRAARAEAGRLLHDFNVEYDEPTPSPAELAVGVAVLRLQPSVWSQGSEAYVAELYVVPSRRGEGYGRELLTEAMRFSRERGADYALVVTSEDDRVAQRLYEAAGFRRTEGEDGPLMLAYEREL